MDTNEEIRNGYLVTAQMKKVWAIHMEMLAQLLDVCRRNGLRIWADSGTLLGAVRHKGYIPWDDDIDMVMFREDYDRLVQIAPHEFRAPLFLQAAETDPLYMRGHAQLRRSDTAAIRPCEVFKPFDQGIFIDIFVMDRLPRTPEDRTRTFAQIETLRSELNAALGSALTKHPLRYLRSVPKVRRAGGCLKYFNRMVDLLKKHPDLSENDVAYVMYSTVGYESLLMDRRWYDRTVQLPFEDITIPAPADYDKVLTRMYGDYMKPVQAPNAHGELIFDTERPYRDLLPALRRKAPLALRLKNLFNFNLIQP